MKGDWKEKNNNVFVHNVGDFDSSALIKGVTMRAFFSNPAGIKFIDSNGRKKIKF